MHCCCRICLPAGQPSLEMFCTVNCLLSPCHETLMRWISMCISRDHLSLARDHFSFDQMTVSTTCAAQIPRDHLFLRGKLSSVQFSFSLVTPSARKNPPKKGKIKLSLGRCMILTDKPTKTFDSVGWLSLGLLFSLSPQTRDALIFFLSTIQRDFIY